MKKNKLGSGIEGLFGSLSEFKEDTVEKIGIDQIKAAKWQPRKTFEVEALDELALSIKEHGILQPILLRRNEDYYEIIAGERRYRAAKQADLQLVPALVVNFDNKKSLQVSMIENLQRKDLNPIEKAEGFQFLINELNLTQEELGEKLGLSRSYIANYLRVNKLSDEIKAKIASGEMSMSHAKVIASKKNINEIASKVLDSNLSVRDLEKLTSSKKEGKSNNAEIKRFEEMISDALGIDTTVKCEKNSGEVILKFSSLNELEDIISKICL